MTAIRKKYNDLAIEMIKMGVNISTAEEYKYTDNPTIYFERKHAFYVAMSEGKENLSLIHAFLEAGLNINISGIRFEENPHITSSPLHFAIGYKKLEVARLLLAQGANTELTTWYPVTGKGTKHGTPLYLAVEANYKDGALLLLEYGADPLKISTNNTSPLELAIQQGYDDLVELLLDFI